MESLHKLRKLLLKFSAMHGEQYGHWTMGMVNGFLVKEGLMEVCHHERAERVTSNSPQGLRHGKRCPDCDKSIFWAVGVTDGDL
jgi:hypothetical protein